MKTKDVIERAAGATNLANMLEITPSAISQWGENVPKARVWQLQVKRPEWFTKTGEFASARVAATAGA